MISVPDIALPDGIRWYRFARVSLWLLALTVFLSETIPFISYLVSQYQTFFGHRQTLPPLESLRSGLTAAHKAAPFIIQVPLLLAAYSVLGKRLNGTNVSLSVLLSGGINATGVFASDIYEVLVNMAITTIIVLGLFMTYKKKQLTSIFGTLMAASLLGMLLIAHFFIVVSIEGSARSQSVQAIGEHIGAISARRDERACTMSSYDCQRIRACDGYLDSNTHLRSIVEEICMEMGASVPGSSSVLTVKQKDNIHLIGYVRDKDNDLVMVDVHHARNHAKIEIVMSAMVFLLCTVISLSGIALVNVHRRSGQRAG